LLFSFLFPARGLDIKAAEIISFWRSGDRRGAVLRRDFLRAGLRRAARGGFADMARLFR